MPQRDYPYQDGDVTVLGPEIFASSDGAVISWKGDNYVPQKDPASRPASPARPMTGPSLTYIGAPHDGSQIALRVDTDSPSDPRERALCRALLNHALALLDATEPARHIGVEARRP